MMRLVKMRFKGFEWAENPTELVVKHSKSTKETLLPFFGSRVAELGTAKRRVEGKGFFTGENALESFAQLKACFDEAGAGMLKLPSHEPFLAVMDKLSMIGAPGSTVEYSFGFTETEGLHAVSSYGETSAQENKSLWDYATQAVPIEQLVRLNPHIRDIGSLVKGERVVLR